MHNLWTNVWTPPSRRTRGPADADREHVPRRRECLT